MTLTPADLLRFLVEFLLLLAFARGLGEVARRLNQPQVIGELLAGVVLGPSLYGALAPRLFQRTFPSHGVAPLLLQVLAQFGVILLLLLSGIEVDLDLVRRKAKPALSVALASVAVPFLLGYVLALFLPASLGVQGALRPVFLLFVATAMSLSAIPVIVKILLDLDLMRRDIGQLTLAAGVLNDTAGWFLLAFVSGLASARALPVGGILVSILGTLAFAGFTLTIGAKLVRMLIHWVDDHFGGESATLSAVLVVALAGAAVTAALHVEAFLGAFLVGIQLSRIPRLARAARQQLEAMTLGVFAPVFFAVAGLNVDLVCLLQPSLLLVLAAVILVASLGKFLGTYVGARLAGVSPWMSAALGAGMNARGAVEIIVASVGLQLGVLTVPMYSIIVTMAVATSVMAPPLLRAALSRAPVDPVEEERLRRERREAKSFLHGVRRLLVPIRDGRYALVAGEVVAHLAGTRTVEAVALHVRNTGQGEDSEPPLPGVAGDSVRVEWKRRVVTAGSGVAAAILAEARRSYDLLVLGATAGRAARGLFGPVADAVVQGAPCPVLILKAPEWRREGVRVRRLLLPTAGTQADARTAEFAVALARGTGAELVALSIGEASPLTEPFAGRSLTGMDASLEHAWQATAAVARLAEEARVPVRQEVHGREGSTVGEAIARHAAAIGCDLILLHAERRVSHEELYCGRTVEQVLASARCPVAVLFDPAE